MAIGAGVRHADASTDVIRVVAFPGELFIRVFKSVLGPFVFSLMLCVMNEKTPISAAQLRRTVLLYALTTVLAAFEALAVFELVRPGEHLDLPAEEPAPAAPSAGAKQNAAAAGAMDTVSVPEVLLRLGRDVVPQNVLLALTEVNLLSIIASGVAIGLAVRAQLGARAAPPPTAAGVAAADAGAALLLEYARGVCTTLLYLVERLVVLAPLGVCSLVAASVARTNVFGLLGALARLLLAQLLAYALHATLTLSALLRVVGKQRRPWAYLRGMSRAVAVAFATASSAATLPTTQRCCKELGLRSSTVEFVLPLGATVNMDGGAIGATLNVLFVAASSGYVHTMGAAGRLTVVVLACALSVGSAPIPGAGFVLYAITMRAAGVPSTAALGYVISSEWLVERFRTAMNVLGDAVVCACVDATASDGESAGSSHAESAAAVDRTALRRTHRQLHDPDPLEGSLDVARWHDGDASAAADSCGAAAVGCSVGGGEIQMVMAPGHTSGGESAMSTMPPNGDADDAAHGAITAEVVGARPAPRCAPDIELPSVEPQMQP